MKYQCCVQPPFLDQRNIHRQSIADISQFEPITEEIFNVGVTNAHDDAALAAIGVQFDSVNGADPTELILSCLTVFVDIDKAIEDASGVDAPEQDTKSDMQVCQTQGQALQKDPSFATKRWLTDGTDQRSYRIKKIFGDKKG